MLEIVVRPLPDDSSRPFANRGTALGQALTDEADQVAADIGRAEVGVPGIDSHGMLDAELVEQGGESR